MPGSSRTARARAGGTLDAMDTTDTTTPTTRPTATEPGGTDTEVRDSAAADSAATDGAATDGAARNGAATDGAAARAGDTAGVGAPTDATEGAGTSWTPPADAGTSAGPSAGSWPGHPAGPAAQRPGRPPFRIYRSRSQRMIGGVCGGLAEALGVDATLLRVGLVALTLLGGGIGIPLYLAVWLIAPER
jgi:phage shock protein C